MFVLRKKSSYFTSRRAIGIIPMRYYWAIKTSVFVHSCGISVQVNNSEVQYPKGIAQWVKTLTYSQKYMGSFACQPTLCNMCSSLHLINIWGTNVRSYSKIVYTERMCINNICSNTYYHGYKSIHMYIYPGDAIYYVRTK